MYAKVSIDNNRSSLILSMLIYYNLLVLPIDLWIYSSQVRLGDPGWKERYYEEKFSAKSPEELDAVRRDVVSCSTWFPWLEGWETNLLSGKYIQSGFLRTYEEDPFLNSCLKYCITGPEIHRRFMLGYALLLWRGLLLAMESFCPLLFFA